MTHAIAIEDYISFHSHLFELKNRILEILNKIHPFFSALRRRFRFRTGIITFLRNSIKKDLTKVLLNVEGLNVSISRKELFEINDEDLALLDVLFSKVKVSYGKLYKLDFIGDPQIKIVANSLISELYTLENKMKDIVFSKTTTIKTDSDVLQYISKISVNSALQLAQ